MSSEECFDESDSGSVGSSRVGSLITFSSRYGLVRRRRIVGIQRLLGVDGLKELAHILEHSVCVEAFVPPDRLGRFIGATVGALVQLELGLACLLEGWVPAHDLVLTIDEGGHFPTTAVRLDSRVEDVRERFGNRLLVFHRSQTCPAALDVKRARGGRRYD